MYLSDDFGNSWRKPRGGFNNIYFHPHTTQNEKGRIFLWDHLHCIYSSSNNGNIWEQHYYQLPGDRRITAFAAAGDSCFIGVAGGLQVAFGSGFSTTTASVSGFANMEVTALLVNGSVVVVGTDGKGLFISEDRGKTWTNRTPQVTASLTFTSLVMEGNKLLAGTRLQGVYYSGDLGKQWRPKNTGLQNLTITDLHLAGDKLYATTSYYNVYTAKIDSSGWQILNANVLGTEHLPKSIVAKGSTLLVGTGFGLFKRTDAGVTWHPSYRGVKDGHITSFQVDADSTLWATSSPTRSIYRKRKADSTFSFYKERISS